MALDDLIYRFRKSLRIPGPAAVLIDTAIEAVGTAAGTAAGVAAVAAVQADADLAKAACVVVAIDDVADVGSGGTTAVVGLQLKDLDGANVAAARTVAFGAYADANGAAASSGGTLDTATAGTILTGAASAALTVVTDSNGKFTCTLTDAVDEVVYLLAGPTVRSPILDCKDVDSVEFTA